ncbi:MAG TPA: M20/M25/M40 family metallo-hydrolase [Thermoanaerobaculia bacterium]
MLDPIRLARELIDIPSTTGEERAAGELLHALMERLTFRCSRQDLTEGRFNLLALGAEEPSVLFCSHIDTVPPFFASRDDAETLYGRGACDAKGIIAAMICAGERLLEAGRRDFGFLFVVGEETDSIGAKRANEALSSHAGRYIVVGEPTESRFVRASKGALTCTIRFEGVAAHSAYPERGESAILTMTKAIDAIDREEWGESDIGKTTVNIGVVRGGAKPNIVPAEAEAEIMFRTAGPHRDVLARLETLLASFGGKIVRWHGNDPTFMHVPEGEESIVVGFNTDAPHLPDLGKAILFGPGSILDAHTANEKITKREIFDAVETYAGLVRRLG